VLMIVWVSFLLLQVIKVNSSLLFLLTSQVYLIFIVFKNLYNMLLVCRMMSRSAVYGIGSFSPYRCVW